LSKSKAPKPKPKPSPVEKKTTGGSWSEADDQYLWTHQHDGRAALASHFGRTGGGIGARLTHLKNPEHKAYVRRISGGSQKGGLLTALRGQGVKSVQERFRESRAFGNALKESKVSTKENSNSNAQNSLARFAHQPPPPKSFKMFPPPASVHMGTCDDYWKTGFCNQFGCQLKHKKNPADEIIISTTSAADPSTLTAEQQKVLECVVSKNPPNIFLSGSAGTGKSHLLRTIIKSLQDKFGVTQVAVTAPTGIAATNLDGVTLHSWSGLGLAKKPAHSLVAEIQKNAKKRAKWRNTQVLVIDEVSMLDRDFFQKLDAVGRAIRGRKDAFGGLQLILCGDFYQLPPVNGGFAFESAVWKACNLKAFILKKVIRQNGDRKFVEILNNCRRGEPTAENLRLLNECHVSKKKLPNDGIEATKLYTTNANVDAENTKRLAQVKSPPMRFLAQDKVKKRGSSYGWESAMKMLEPKAAECLTLKIGAQVMCLKNYPDKGLVNGSRGVVTGFEVSSDNPIVRWTSGNITTMNVEATNFATGEVSLTRIQLPLRLAWALSVHKSQGMTLSRCEVLLNNCFEYGQAYVALSRVTDMKGLIVNGTLLGKREIRAHPKVKDFYEEVDEDACGFEDYNDNDSISEDEIMEVTKEEVIAEEKRKVKKSPTSSYETCMACGNDCGEICEYAQYMAEF
ncbi:hypothetical protein TL16_g08506, partial [Triparma laevis f. inornata]